MLVIPRATLDQRLVERAVRAGAELREGMRVDHVDVHATRARLHMHDGSTLDVDAVVGCDGMPSVVRRSLGARTFRPDEVAQAIRGIYEGAELPYENALALIWERSVLPAYGWMFPLPGGRANVGIGLRMDQLKSSGRSLRSIYEQFLELPWVSKALANATLVGKAKGHPLPMTADPGAYVFDRALLAGDAAGFVNPLTGEGIEYALEIRRARGPHPRASSRTRLLHPARPHALHVGLQRSVLRRPAAQRMAQVRLRHALGSSIAWRARAATRRRFGTTSPVSPWAEREQASRRAWSGPPSEADG